jgi:hypothetical protein
MKRQQLGERSIKTLILLIIFLMSTANIHPGAGPKILFNQATRDFGRVDEGAVLTHVFEFGNTGNSTLIIKKVRTSCGCAAALVSEKQIPAGGKGEISVTFKTRGYEGHQTKYVYVESNDPDQPIMQLSVVAAVNVPPRPQIALKDYSVDLGLLVESEKIKVRTTIMNKGDLELKVDLMHKDARFFRKGEEIKPNVRIPVGKEAVIEIDIPAPKKTGLIREYVLLKSNDPRRPNLSLYLTGYVATRDQLKQLFKKYRDVIEGR